MDDVTITIGVPTYNRPEKLELLLESISCLNSKKNFNVDVLVVDNDGNSGAGINIVKKCKDGFPFKLSSVGEIERGISQVRNKILQIALDDNQSNFLIMVDDDEVVDINWLNSLLETQLKTGADIVGGYIIPNFEICPPSWTDKLPIFWRAKHPEGSIDLIHGTGAVLITRRAWLDFDKPKFDLDFCLTGGEDKEFFLRLKKMGATFAFAPNAVSYEFYDASRIDVNWAKDREYRIGSSDIRIHKKHNRSVLSWSIIILKFVGAYLFYFFLSVILFKCDMQIRCSLKLSRQQGKLDALLGKKFEVYKSQAE